MESKILNKTPSEIVTDIVDAYDNSQGLFKNKVNAEDLLPKTNIENQVQFLFFVIQMDYATKSSALYKNANEQYLKNPDWITTNYLLGLKDKELEDLIKNSLRPRYSNEIFNRFRLNSKKLDDEYSSQAINIVKRSNSAKELLKNIRSFRGFGPKLGNFLTRTYIDILKLDYSDIEDILQPVDVHDVRLTYLWGLIDSDEMTQKNINVVKEIWNDACKSADKSWITFDKALWLIGSEGKRTENVKEDYNFNLGL